MKRKNRSLEISLILLMLSISLIVIYEFPTVFYYAPLAVFAVWLIYACSFNGKIQLSAACVLLAVFSALYVYCIKDLTQQRFYPFYLYLYIVLFYFAGTNTVVSCGKQDMAKKENYFEKVYLCVSLMFISYVTITYVCDFIDGGISKTLEPMYLWTDQTRPSTDYGVMCLPAIVCSAYLFFCKRARFFSVFLLLIVIADNVYTQRRTVFIMIPLLFLVCLVSVYIFGVWKKKTRIIFAASLLGLILAAVPFVCIESDKIKALFAGSPFGRLSDSGIEGIIDNPRFVSLKNLLSNFSFSYTGGEHYAAQYGNPHNMWFNIYDNAGIIPFVLFLLFTVSTVYYLIKLCLFAKNVSGNIKALIVTSFIGMLIQCSIEPVLVSDVAFVMFTFYIFGVIKSFADCADDKYRITDNLKKRAEKSVVSVR